MKNQTSYWSKAFMDHSSGPLSVKDAAAAPCGRIVRDEAPGPGKSAGPGVRRVTSQLGTVVASTMGFTTLISVSIVSASYGAGSSTRKVWKPTRR